MEVDHLSGVVEWRRRFVSLTRRLLRAAARPWRARALNGVVQPQQRGPEERAATSEPSSLLPKVLLVTHELSLSGAPMMVYVLARHLRQEGYPVIVAAPHDGALRTLFSEAGIDTEVVAGLLEDPQAILEFAGRYDVLVANTILAWRLIHGARASGKPSVWWIHESQFGQDFVARQPGAAQALSLADAVIFPAAATARRYAGFAAGANFFTIHYGFDAALTHRASAVFRRVPGKFHVINIGSVEERKGQDTLLDAIQALPTDVAEASEFYFVGRSLDARLLRELTRAARSMKNVHLVGEASHDDAMCHLQAMDVLVLASRDEVLPVTILEAMSLGKGIVATRAGGVGEMIEDGVSGLLVEVESAEQMAASLSRLFHDRSLLASLGAHAQARYAARFSVERFGEQMTRVIRAARHVT